MQNKRKNKISRIENKMNIIGTEISIAKSLSRVLLEILYEDDNLKKWDKSSLAKVLKEKIISLRNKIDDIHSTLKI